MFLATFCSCKDRFVSDLVGNPEDRFSRVAAQLIIIFIQIDYSGALNFDDDYSDDNAFPTLAITNLDNVVAAFWDYLECEFGYYRETQNESFIQVRYWFNVFTMIMMVRTSSQFHESAIARLISCSRLVKCSKKIKDR